MLWWPQCGHCLVILPNLYHTFRIGSRKRMGSHHFRLISSKIRVGIDTRRLYKANDYWVNNQKDWKRAPRMVEGIIDQEMLDRFIQKLIDWLTIGLVLNSAFAARRASIDSGIVVVAVGAHWVQVCVGYFNLCARDLHKVQAEAAQKDEQHWRNSQLWREKPLNWQK